MAVNTKRSPPKKKLVSKSKAKKPKSKPHLKAVKSVAKPKMSAKAPVHEGSSILWKILAERQRRAKDHPPKPNLSDHRGSKYPQSDKHQQFAKFAGPRRRAA